MSQANDASKTTLNQIQSEELPVPQSNNTSLVGLLSDGPPPSKTPLQRNPHINHYWSVVTVLAVADMIQNAFFSLILLLGILDYIFYYSGVHYAFVSAGKILFIPLLRFIFETLLLFCYGAAFCFALLLWKITDPEVDPNQVKCKSCWWSLTNTFVITVEFFNLVWMIFDRRQLFILLTLDGAFYHNVLLLSMAVRCVTIYFASEFRSELGAPT